MELLAYFGILILAILGTPIFIVMSLFALVAFYFVGIDSTAVIVEIYRISTAPTLLTIPLFTFAGFLLADSKSPERLFNLASSALGWMPGGISIVSLVVCAFFTAFTGASGVTIIALGGLLFPILLKESKSEKFTLGLITTSGSLGLLFPPSLPIILYGLVSRVKIDDLFKAGIIPGTILIIVLALWSIKQGDKTKKKKKFSWKELKKSIVAARFEIPLPFLVLGGIYGGFTTVSEAAALTAFYVFIMTCFLYKDLHLTRDVPNILYDCMTLVGAILLILCCAMGLTNYLVDEEIPLKLLELIQSSITNKYVFLAFLNIFLLVVGSLMDIFSAIIVVLPLIIPMAEGFDIHPIHLAIIFLTNLEIGYITPPIGINLFISSFRFKKNMLTIYKSTWPFLLLLLATLILFTYVPQISLFWI